MLATSPRETLINIDAKVISHRRQVTFQLTEVAVSHQTLADILMLIPLVQPDDLAANGDNRHRISLRTALMKRIGTFMRPLTMPKAAEPWSLTSLRDKLIKMGTKVLSHVTTPRSKWLRSG